MQYSHVTRTAILWSIIHDVRLGVLNYAEAEERMFDAGADPRRVFYLLYGADAPFDED